ncbi:MAG: hypothetical protein ACI9JN_001716 [Bacteroidia bacterium]|jgi:hypothetical protein
MIKTLISTFILVGSISTAYSQKISNVDFDLINRTVQDSTSFMSRANVVDRILQGGAVVSDSDYYYLYYSSPESDTYAPYSITVAASSKFTKYYEKQKYAKA